LLLRASEAVAADDTLEKSELARRWSWADKQGEFSPLYKIVRDAHADLSVSNRDEGRHRGVGSSTAVAALTWMQFRRIDLLLSTQIAALELEQKPLPYLGVLKQNAPHLRRQVNNPHLRRPGLTTRPTSTTPRRSRQYPPIIISKIILKDFTNKQNFASGGSAGDTDIWGYWAGPFPPG
jgi:hypothetical protein